MRRVLGQNLPPTTAVDAQTRAFRVKWSSVDRRLVDKAIELAENWTSSMSEFWERSSGGKVTPEEEARLYQKALDTVADPWLRSMTK